MAGFINGLGEGQHFSLPANTQTATGNSVGAPQTDDGLGSVLSLFSGEANATGGDDTMNTIMGVMQLGTQFGLLGGDSTGGGLPGLPLPLFGGNSRANQPQEVVVRHVAADTPATGGDVALLQPNEDTPETNPEAAEDDEEDGDGGGDWWKDLVSAGVGLAAGYFTGGIATGLATKVTQKALEDV
ncbi:MAG: hypothetical protein SFZ03_09090 [Candidatus Melainabacteria bacterium]|nr:hypothetical protein [Candidatus Melainabacteria bacterium]